MKNKLNRLIEIAENSGAFKTGNFLLSSGKKSKIYFDGRIISLIPESLEIISSEILDEILSKKANTLAGPTLGADPIIGGTLIKAKEKEIPLRGAIVRKTAKEHGTGNQIEGIIRSTDKVIIVDDTCTTGGSLLMAAKAVEKQGCSIAGIICVVDRDEGGRQAIEKAGYKFNSLLKVENLKLIPCF